MNYVASSFGDNPFPPDQSFIFHRGNLIKRTSLMQVFPKWVDGWVSGARGDLMRFFEILFWFHGFSRRLFGWLVICWYFFRLLGFNLFLISLRFFFWDSLWNILRLFLKSSAIIYNLRNCYWILNWLKQVSFPWLVQFRIEFVMSTLLRNYMNWSEWKHQWGSYYSQLILSQFNSVHCIFVSVA